MLILSRKMGESICLPGTNTTITIHRTLGGRVSLAVDAPQEVAIVRGELMPLEEDSPAHFGFLEHQVVMKPR